MDLRQLTIFRTVARTLSFTRAAARLNYVQSNVTAQIRALEEELGVPLFDRLGSRQVVLTDAGHQLLAYADQLLDLAAEAQTVVSQAGEAQGTLRIAASPTLCIYRLPALLRAFRARYPRVHLIFRPVPVNDIPHLVHTGNIDVAFVYELPDVHPSEPGNELLAYEQVWLLAPPDHPLAALDKLELTDLSGVDMLMTEGGCCYRQLFEQELNQKGVYPATTLEFGSIEAVKQCVMTGLGLTVLPAVAVATEVAQGQLIRLRWTSSDPSIVSRMIWNKDRWLSPAIQAFLALSREMLAHETFLCPNLLPMSANSDLNEIQ